MGEQALKPRAAFAGLFGPPPTNRASDASDKVKEMMKQMEKQNGGAGLSAESMYNQSGGACGNGNREREREREREYLAVGAGLQNIL